MTYRDYSPFGDEGDLPGDSVETAALGKRYTDTAEEIKNCADNLNKIKDAVDHGNWVSLAGPKFQDKCGDLSGRIRQAQGRYEACGKALTQWSTDMEDAQTRGAQAAADARTANQTIANNPKGDPKNPPANDTQASHQQDMDTARGNAQDALDAAQKRWNTAVSDYKQYAQNARNTIHGGDQNDGLKDSWFYKHFSDIGKWLMIITIIVVIICVVLLVVCCPAVLAFIATLGAFGAGLAAALPAIAAVFEAISLVLAVITLAVDVKGKSEGLDVSWGTIALDISVLATAGLAKFVKLAIVGKSADAAEQTAKAAKAADAADKVMSDWAKAFDDAGFFGKFKQLIKLPGTISESSKAGKAAAEAFSKSLAESAEGNTKLMNILLNRSVENSVKLEKLKILAQTDPDAAAALRRAQAAARLAGISTDVTDIGSNANAAHNAHNDAQAEKNMPQVENDADNAQQKALQHVGGPRK